MIQLKETSFFLNTCRNFLLFMVQNLPAHVCKTEKQRNSLNKLTYNDRRKEKKKEKKNSLSVTRVVFHGRLPGITFYSNYE
jgi:hypothetical protein